MKGKLLVTAIFIVFSFSIFLLAQDEGLISYKVDGKEFRFTDAVFEFHPLDGWGSIKGGKVERIKMGGYPFPQYRDIEVGIWVDIAQDEQSIVGKHEANISDLMPISVSWFEWIDKEKGEIKEIYLQQDDSGAEKSMFTVIFENFGPPGTIIKGTFYGKLVDDEGNVYEVSEGRFEIKRVDVD